jgi:ABC-type glycerol-3-phosphate transport system substrate-binding protein
MPRKAVAIYLILALLGAAIFIYLTFPRTKDQIPTSNNQRPFAEPPSPNPGNAPVPETTPHPSTPAPPHGPTLRVMAWASPAEAQALSDQLDAYGAQTGWYASLTVLDDEASYRRELATDLASNTPPDVCLVNGRDFSGLDPARDLDNVTPDPGSASRSLAAFTLDGAEKACPAEFSVDLLFFNPAIFNRAGIAQPGPHWNWDVLQAMAHALGTLRQTTATGETIYPLEVPADFDFWNLLCSQAGHPALEAGTWHLGDADGRDAELRSLGLIRDFFGDRNATAPLPSNGTEPGRYFGEQRAAMMIGPSELVASLPNFGYQVTGLPRDMCAASLARVNGWAVAARSSQPGGAQALAVWLARRPLHAGWSSVQTSVAQDGFTEICQASLAASVIPRLGTRDAQLARFLDDQIQQLARPGGGDPGQLYARIQAEYQSDFPESATKPSDPVKAHASAPASELRDM